MKIKNLKSVGAAAAMTAMMVLPASQASAFLIEAYQTGGAITSTTSAEAIASDGANLVGSANFDTINMFDGLGSNGHFGGDDDFPLGGNAATDFAISASGDFMIDTAGVWTFGVNTDDGVSVIIDGMELIRHEGLTDNIDLFTVEGMMVGLHSLEMTFFEHGGGASIEFFAAMGAKNGFDGDFELVESYSSVPEPSTLGLFGIALALGGLVRRRSQKARA